MRRWRLIASLAVVGIFGYGAHTAFTAFVGHHSFKVQRVVVHGNRRLSNGEVAALLEGLRGESLLAVNLEQWRRGIMNSPWVADASLRRTLPSTIDVTVVERTPLGIGRIDGLLYLVDDRGAVIDEYGPNYADLDLPIIDGLTSSAGEAHSNPARAALARRLLDALGVRNLAERISQIDVSDARNAVVLLHGDSTTIRLGHERFAERLQLYFDLAPTLRETVPEIDYVDLRFDGRVYVRPAGQAASRVPKAAKGAQPQQPSMGPGPGREDLPRGGRGGREAAREGL